MTVLVVRHAKAGDRERWSGADHERPLSKRGRAQADALVALLPPLAGTPVGRVLSSSYVRCRQTVEPFAAAVGLAVEDEPALAEGQPLSATLALIARLGPAPAVLCSHGDVIADLVTWLAMRELVEPSGDLRWAKGSTWVVERDLDGRPTSARYVEAP